MGVKDLVERVNIFDRSVGMVMGKPSRFIEEISPDLLRPWTLVEQDTAWST